MRLAQVINALLSNMNLAVMRRNTLDRILTELQALQNARSARESQVSPDSIAVRSDNTIQHLQDLRRELLRHQVATKWEVVDFVIRTMAHEVKNRHCPLCGYQDVNDAFAKFETQCIFGGGATAALSVS